MKKYFFFILLLLNCDSIYAQSTKYVPQILVLGTVHSGNKKITHNSLYNALAKFQPDVILWEDEEDFKYVFGLFTAYRLKIAKPPMEQLALQKYKRHHKMVPMLGFDTIIKPRKTFIKNLITTYDAFHEAMGQLKMNLSDSLQYATFIKLQDAYYNQFMFSPLSFINQDSVFRKSMTIKKMKNQIVHYCLWRPWCNEIHRPLSDHWKSQGSANLNWQNSSVAPALLLSSSSKPYLGEP
jgi:hypothetical protein